MRIEILKNQREHFEKACAIYAVSYEMYNNEKNPEWEFAILPKMTDKEAWDLCMTYQMGIREEVINSMI